MFILSLDKGGYRHFNFDTYVIGINLIDKYNVYDRLFIIFVVCRSEILNIKNIIYIIY